MEVCVSSIRNSLSVVYHDSTVSLSIISDLVDLDMMNMMRWLGRFRKRMSPNAPHEKTTKYRPKVLEVRKESICSYVKNGTVEDIDSFTRPNLF